MIILYIIIFSLIMIIYFQQEKLLLLGKKIKPNWKPIIDYQYEEIYFPIREGKKQILLHGILYKSKNPSKGVIIYYHGNKGNMDTVAFNGLSYLSNDFDMAMLDYRGYGKSEGSITTPEQLLNDAIMFFDNIINIYSDFKNNKKIIIVGKSLGTGLATHVAANRKSNMLMLITPYDKLYKVAKNKYNWLPTKFLFKYLIPSIDWLANINVPIRIIHGTKDNIIFPERAENYYKKAQELGKNVTIVWLKGALHDNLENYVEYHNWIKNCLDENFK